MPSEASRSGVVLELAEEFLGRYRRGERPSLKEYIDRRPDLAAEIREVFPAMALMENIALADESLEPASRERQQPEALQQLGDYRIIREIGRGGMGIVYEAEQVSLGRHVALKVLPQQLLVDERSKRRFEREAKAAAKLHHTNIVPVFGVGEHDGLPYYVMQLIQGLGLDAVLGELKRLHPGGKPIQMVSLTPSGHPPAPKEVTVDGVARSLLTGQFEQTVDVPPAAEETAPRLETSGSSSVTLPRSTKRDTAPTYWQSVAQLGVQIAEALAYAHKQGVLHRDIKPSNLLLDVRGTVWVTDFGLAKAEGSDNLTHTGDIVGTLRYMAPERFQGKGDLRSDLYALGLTLYELLALRPAFDETDRTRLIKQVTEAEPPRLQRLNPAIPRDLVTIVHKAIDREPGHRYATAEELASDLQRFLDDEPIKARRLRLRERGGRWCRRNPAVASLLAALVLVFLSGFALVAWKWREANLARAEAVQARQLAEAKAAEIQQGIERLNRANRLLQSGRRHANEGRWAEAERDLTNAVALHPDNSLIWSERANLYLQLGLWKDAAADFSEQLKRQPAEDDVELWFRQALLLLHAGNTAGYRQTCADMLLRFGQKTDPTVAGYVAVSCALAPDAVADPFRAVELAKRAVAKRPGFAPNLYDLGIASYRAGQFTEAVRYLRESRAAGKDWEAAILTRPVLAMALYRLGQPEEAQKSLAEVDEWTGRVSTIFSRNAVVQPLSQWWDWAELQLLYREATTLLQGRAESDHPRVWLARGLAHAALERWDAAAAAYAQALELRPRDPSLWIERGWFHARRGQWDQVATAFGRAVALPPEDAWIWAERARCYASFDQRDQAVADFTRAIGLSPKNWSLRAERGRLYAQQQRWDDVAADFGEVLELLPVQDGSSPSSESTQVITELLQWEEAFDRVLRRRPKDARLWVALGRAHARRGQWDQAAAAYAKTVEAPASLEDHLEHACAQLLAGDTDGYRQSCTRLLERHGRTEDPHTAYIVARTCALAPKAVADPRQPIALAEKALASNPQRFHLLGAYQQALGMACYRGGELGRAAQNLRASAANGRNWDWIGARTNWPMLALVHHHLGQREEARAWMQNAAQWSDTAARQLETQTVGVDWLEFQVVYREAEALLNAPHRREAEECLKKQQWTDAIAYLSHLIKADPAHWPDRISRGRAHAQLGQWGPAAIDFSQALERVSASSNPWWADRGGSDDELVQWDEVFDRVAKLRPTDWQLWVARARRFARRRQWQQAAAASAKVLELEPSCEWNWFNDAALRAQLGDVEGYRLDCKEMLARFGQTKNPQVADVTAKTCLLLPDAGGDRELIVKLAEQAVTDTERHPSRRWFLVCRALAHYREGQFTRAVERVESLKPNPDGWSPDATAYAIAALAHHRLNQPDEARQALAKAAAIVEQKLPKPDRGELFGNDWHDWLRCQIIHREATALIDGK